MQNRQLTQKVTPNCLKLQVSITQASSKSLKYPVSSYNLAVGSTPFGIHYLLFKHLVKQGKQPKTLIYGFVDNELTDTIFFDDAYLAQVS
ncbi:MAG: hypothetical protein ACYT04_93080, partial [Nostoc sp.]